MKFIAPKPARSEAGGDPRLLPSPDQLPVRAQEALASFLAATRRPFAPSIAQLATEHLTFFIQLRAMGARWDQVADFVFEQGFTGPNGKISGAVWRASVSRALRNRASEAAGTALDVETPSETKGIESKRNETMQPAALQTAAERSATKPDAPEWGVTERDAWERKGSAATAATSNAAKRDNTRQSETPRNESTGNAPQRNVRGPPAAPVRTPPELRAGTEFARIADLVDKPFRTRT